MKLIILKNNLVDGLLSLERSVSENPNLPILKNFLIKTENNKILFSATNLEMAVTGTVPGKIIEGGETTIPFSITANIVKNLVAERVSLELKGNKFNISTENYEASLQNQETKDFPIIPDIKNKNSFFEIDIETLKEGVGSTIVATQHSEIRPEISGVFLKLSRSEGLVLVATDSFRLSKKTITPGSFETKTEEASAIIPLKTAAEVLRIFKKEEGKIKIFIEPNQIVFETTSTKLTSHLIDGRFPEYEAVIPKTTPTEIIVEREEFMNAVKLVSSFSSRINDLSLKVADNKKSLEILSASGNLGENKYMISARIKGEKTSIVFNWKYLLDGLKIYGKSADIVLGIASPDRPAVIKSQNEPSLVYIVMPLKA